MNTFNSIVPFLLGILVMIGAPMFLAAIVFFIISFSGGDENVKRNNRKISYYLCIPLVLMFIVVILWGLVALIQNL